LVASAVNVDEGVAVGVGLSLEEQQLDLQLMLKSQIISQLIFHDC
jgi:hypothetical protein